jgi:hypothetical protein
MKLGFFLVFVCVATVAMGGCAQTTAAYGQARHPSDSGGGYYNAHPCWDCIQNRQIPPIHGAN